MGTSDHFKPSSSSTEGPTGTNSHPTVNPDPHSASTFVLPAPPNETTRPDSGPERLDHGTDPRLQPDTGASTVSTPQSEWPSSNPKVDAVRTIGSYYLIELLGGGSQGEVWRAIQFDPIYRTVALKVLWHHLALNTDAAERMRKEAERGGRLNHETILPVLDFGRVGELVYIAMPLVDGFTLSQVIATRRAWLDRKAPSELPRLAILSDSVYIKAMARLMERVARALAHAHADRIIHRDIKPSNILIDRSDDQRVFLADFGLARDLDDITADLGHEPGTLLYMPPERLKGHGKYDECRADLYSMGVTLFEAITLHRAFKVPSDLPRVSWPSYLVGQAPPSPRSLSPQVHRDLAAIIEKSMDPNPSRRYESATALADDLDNFVEGRPVIARPPGPARRAGRWLAARRGVMLTLGLLATLLVAAGLVLLGGQINRARARSNFRLASEFASRGQLLEAYASYDRGLQQSPQEPEAESVRQSMIRALQSKVLELAEGDDVEAVAEVLDLFRKVTEFHPSIRIPLSRRLGLRTLELTADAPNATFLVHPIRPDGRPRLDRVLHQGFVADRGLPLSLPDLVPGRYWVTATIAGGETFDERPVILPPARNVQLEGSYRVFLSLRSDPPVGMVRIAGGEFRMGRDFPQSRHRVPSGIEPDMPAADAVVPSFDLDAAEVTNAEFAKFLEATGHQDWAREVWNEKEDHRYKPGQDRWPVTHVNYEQALAYAAWRGCRLPTEHELEFAARTAAGQTQASTTARLDLHAVDDNPGDISNQGAQPIHGLMGNSGELTLFFFRPYPSFSIHRARNDAWNGIAVRSGLISGGKISPTMPVFLGKLGRASQLPSQASVHVGFRCARSVRPWTETGPPHFKIQE